MNPLQKDKNHEFTNCNELEMNILLFVLIREFVVKLILQTINNTTRKRKNFKPLLFLYQIHLKNYPIKILLS